MRVPRPRTLFLTGLALLAIAVVAAVFFAKPQRRPPATPTATTTQPPPPPPPVAAFAILNAAASSVGPYSATLRWQATRPATARVDWGPAAMRPLLVSQVDRPQTSSAVRLDGLAAATRYVARIEIRSRRGEADATTVSFETAPAPSAVAASTRAGAIVVDGGTFFPLLTWQECPGRWEPDLADGIDLFAGNPCTGLPSLLTAVQGRALAAGTSDDTPGVTGAGLLGWFYADEADGRGLSAASLAPGGAGLRFLTLTGHFWSGAAPLPEGRGMYPALIARTDVVGFDLYPLQSICRPDLLPGVFDAQRRLVALAAPRPTFQWIEVRQMNCPDAASAVTPGTIRVESWLAIAGGAHGLGFFPGDWGTVVGRTIRGITARIRQVEPALLRPPVPVRVEYGTPAVRVSARELNGALYVIAVNAARSATPVRFDVPGLDGRTLAIAGTTKVIHTHGDLLLATLPAMSAYVLVAPPR